MSKKEAKSMIFGLDLAQDGTGSVSARLPGSVEREKEAWKYRVFESALAERTIEVGESNLREYLAQSRFHPDFDQMVKVKTFSMLHTDVLLLLRLFALASKMPVLEIGPYLGGSTIAICHGLRWSRRMLPLISIEAGGSYLDHPHVPTADIISDLRKNIGAAKVDDMVHVIHGHSRDSDVVERVRTRLGGQRLGMIMIDADGHVEHDWAAYGDLMAPQSIVAIDDYVSDLAGEKASCIKPWVDRMVSEMRFRPLGIYGWGTWFGQVTS